MTKRNVLLAVVIFVVIFFISVFSREISICPSFSYSSCAEFFDAFAAIIFSIISLFVFSLITFKMRDEVYQTWWKFASVVTALSMFAILISPSNSSNWMFPIEKGNVAALSSLTFIISNILVISFKYNSLKRKYNYSMRASYAILIFSLVVSSVIMFAIAGMM